MGGVYVTFPYFASKNGVLKGVTMPPGAQSFQIGDAGRVTSHRVKYSHHPTGLAVFSQTGKIQSEIRNQSVPLTQADAEGHVFTVHVRGFDLLDHRQALTPES